VAEEQNIGAFLQPGIARCQRHDLGFRDHWHGLEVERGERLAGGQTRLGEMPFQAAATAVGHFVLGQRRQKAGCRPASLSDCSASLAHLSLMPGKRNSLSKSSTRAASTV